MSPFKRFTGYLHLAIGSVLLLASGLLWLDSLASANQQRPIKPWTTIAQVPLNAWYRPATEARRQRGLTTQVIPWARIEDWTDATADYPAAVRMRGETFSTPVDAMLVEWEYTIGDGVVRPCGSR